LIFRFGETTEDELDRVRSRQESKGLRRDLIPDGLVAWSRLVEFQIDLPGPSAYDPGLTSPSIWPFGRWRLLMQALLGILLATQIGTGGPSEPAVTAPPLVSPGAKGGPTISFELRKISVASPEWRGKFIPSLQPIARHEGAAVWALDSAGVLELLTYLQGDTRCNVLQAPKMIARIGEPVRMSSETGTRYVASLKRVADGPPSQATRIAFEPQIDQVHDGIRVNVLSSQLKGKDLLAKIEINENRLLGIYTALYTEVLKGKTAEKTTHDVMGLLQDRLHLNLGTDRQAISAQIQVPEVDSRRIDGEWLIPSDGALLVSLGPCTERSGVIRKQYEERMVMISVKPVAEAAASQPSHASASLPKPITGLFPQTP
jgi:hypothetical protein